MARKRPAKQKNMNNRAVLLISRAPCFLAGRINSFNCYRCAHNLNHSDVVAKNSYVKKTRTKTLRFHPFDDRYDVIRGKKEGRNIQQEILQRESVFKRKQN